MEMFKSALQNQRRDQGLVSDNEAFVSTWQRDDARAPALRGGAGAGRRVPGAAESLGVVWHLRGARQVSHVPIWQSLRIVQVAAFYPWRNRVPLHIYIRREGRDSGIAVYFHPHLQLRVYRRAFAFVIVSWKILKRHKERKTVQCGTWKYGTCVAHENAFIAWL